MTFRTPKKRVNPSATRAYISPSITPFIRYWARRSIALSALGGSAPLQLALSAGVLAVLPHHPLAVLDDIGRDGGNRVLPVVVEGDDPDDGVPALHLAQGRQHLLAVRAHLLDGVHEEGRCGEGEGPVRLRGIGVFLLGVLLEEELAAWK